MIFESVAISANVEIFPFIQLSDVDKENDGKCKLTMNDVDISLINSEIAARFVWLAGCSLDMKNVRSLKETPSFYVYSYVE